MTVFELYLYVYDQMAKYAIVPPSIFIFGGAQSGWEVGQGVPEGPYQCQTYRGLGTT
jgi:hypothetical protein